MPNLGRLLLTTNPLEIHLKLLSHEQSDLQEYKENKKLPHAFKEHGNKKGQG